MNEPIHPKQEKASVAETTDGVLASSAILHEREPIPDLRPLAMSIDGEPVAPSAQDAINEMVENGWQPDALMRHLRDLGPILEQWASEPGFPRHSGLFMLSAATAIENQGRLIADLEAKLDAERTLRAQGAADLERENAHERDRRIGAESRARDALWALDAAIEALVPLAGYATEEDGRVAGMTNPVCLAMSSVRRADALVKLHRALRR